MYVNDVWNLPPFTFIFTESAAFGYFSFAQLGKVMQVQRLGTLFFGLEVNRPFKTVVQDFDGQCIKSEHHSM
jgi:hypothetical protein